MMISVLAGAVLVVRGAEALSLARSLVGDGSGVIGKAASSRLGVGGGSWKRIALGPTLGRYAASAVAMNTSDNNPVLAA